MKWFLASLLIVLSGQSIFAQIAREDAAVLTSVLLKKEIARKIFFYYDEGGKPPRDLPPGNYAFIIPDTSFQKIYKGIVELMPYTIATDSLLYKKKLYKDSTRAIYIDGIIHYNLFVVFEKIKVYRSNATINFYTTSRVYEDKFKDRYVRVSASLEKRDGKWIVSRQKIDTIPWIDYIKKRSIKR